MAETVDFETLYPDIRDTGDTNLRRCQLVMGRMLKVMHHLCEKHDVRYFLIFGSLLGAIRHKGFIPWDDDLDVGMTRSDYETFIEKVVPELPNDIFFQNSVTDKHYPPSGVVEARLRDKYSKYTDKYKYHDGLLVDIFVYDKAYLPSQPLIVLQNRILRLFRSDKIRAAILKKIASMSDKLLYCNSFYYKLYQMSGQLCAFEEDWFFPLKKASFEDFEVYIPNNYEAYLTRMYGDYMTLPPKDQRYGHHTEQPDPFTPCNHPETLVWKRKTAKKQRRYNF